MTAYLPTILAAALLAFLGTPITRLLAKRFGMIDQPGVRKAHRSPVPLLGGLAMYSALVLVFLSFGQQDWFGETLAVLFGMTVLFGTGLWDDRYGTPVWVKLAAQCVAAAGLLLAGLHVQLVHPVVDVLITIVWVVGITNAVNFMDNMDGLAAGVTAVGAAGFFLLAFLEGQGLVASLAAALFGAALGFLFYNFAPAISFMGDAGSMTLGFVLAVLGIKLKFLSYSVTSTWMAPILVLGVLIFDTTLVMVSRIRRGRSPWQGGSDHTSHRLAQLGLGQPRAVMTLYATAAALSLLALWVVRQPAAQANLVFGGALVLGGIALVLFERIEPKLSGDPLLVVIPGGDNVVDAVKAARALSREVVVLLAPRLVQGKVQPTRWEVLETLALLADNPESVRRLLERGLSEFWWHDLHTLNGALRLTGAVWAVTDSPLEALPAPTDLPISPSDPALGDIFNAVRKARLVLLGPGNPEVNVLPVLATPGLRTALAEARGPRVWGGLAAEAAPLTAWLAEPPMPLPAAPNLADAMQKQLLRAAAGHSKAEGEKK